MDDLMRTRRKMEKEWMWGLSMIYMMGKKISTHTDFEWENMTGVGS